VYSQLLVAVAAQVVVTPAEQTEDKVVLAVTLVCQLLEVLPRYPQPTVETTRLAHTTAPVVLVRL
jgi:hypothetical protein